LKRRNVGHDLRACRIKKLSDDNLLDCPIIEIARFFSEPVDYESTSDLLPYVYLVDKWETEVTDQYLNEERVCQTEAHYEVTDVRLTSKGINTHCGLPLRQKIVTGFIQIIRRFISRSIKGSIAALQVNVFFHKQ